MSFGRPSSMGRGFGRVGAGGGTPDAIPGVLAALSGGYIWSGQAATLTVQRLLAASGGSYTYTGQDASLLKSTLSLIADAGSYTWTGDAMTPLVDHKLPADSSSYTYTGQAATLLATRFVTASVGSYAFTGQDATLTKSGASTTTLNPSDKAAAVTLSGGDLIMTNSGAGLVRSVASYSSGKKYYEVTLGAGVNAYDHAVGAANSSASLTSGPGSPDTNSIAYYNGDANVYANNTSAGSTGLTAVAPGDIISVAIDLDNSTIWIRLNGGNWNNNASNDPATNTGGIDVSAISKPWYAMGYGGANGAVNTFNFGASAYSYTAPSGFGNW